MTRSMKNALEILKKHTTLHRPRTYYTDWIPVGEEPVYETRWHGHDVCTNPDTVQSASIGRLVDAGWAEYTDKSKAMVRYVDRDAPLREAVELLGYFRGSSESACGECRFRPDFEGERCKGCELLEEMKKADAFLKEHGGGHA